MAAGDHRAVFTFYAEFGPTLRSMAASEARRQGAGHLGRDDLDGVALDFCLDLCRAAGRWHAGSALPWVWARRQLRHRVAEAAGQLAFPLDTVDPPEPTPITAPLDPDPLETLERLARATNGARPWPTRRATTRATCASSCSSASSAAKEIPRRPARSGANSGSRRWRCARPHRASGPACA